MCVSPVSIADSKPQQVGTRGGLTTREEVKVEFGLFAVDGRDDGVAGVVAAGAPRADVDLAREDINKLSLACRVCNLGQHTLWGSCPRSAAGARLCPFGWAATAPNSTTTAWAASRVTAVASWRLLLCPRACNDGPGGVER